MSATRRTPRKTMTITELAEVLGVGRSTLYLELKEHGNILGIVPLRVRNRSVFSRALVEEALRHGPARDERAA